MHNWWERWRFKENSTHQAHIYPATRKRTRGTAGLCLLTAGDSTQEESVRSAPQSQHSHAPHSMRQGQAGWSVLTAANGAQAVSCLRDLPLLFLTHIRDVSRMPVQELFFLLQTGMTPLWRRHCDSAGGTEKDGNTQTARWPKTLLRKKHALAISSLSQTKVAADEIARQSKMQKEAVLVRLGFMQYRVNCGTKRNSN